MCRDALFDSTTVNPLGRHVKFRLKGLQTTSGGQMWTGAIKDMNLHQ